MSGWITSPFGEVIAWITPHVLADVDGLQFVNPEGKEDVYLIVVSRKNELVSSNNLANRILSNGKMAIKCGKCADFDSLDACCYFEMRYCHRLGS